MSPSLSILFLLGLLSVAEGWLAYGPPLSSRSVGRDGRQSIWVNSKNGLFEAEGARVTEDDVATPSAPSRLLNDLPPTPTIENNLQEASNPFLPYQGKQPAEALSEIFIRQILPDNADDEKLWVPQTDTVSFRPLCFCVSSGYYVNLLRVRGSGLLSRHKHPAPVHGYVLKGRWKYLEHTWEAQAGSYVFEPPGEIHTLEVPDGVDEMITLFHVTGSLLYCDALGKVTGAEDVFTKLELAKKHYKEVGLGEDFVQQFLR